MPGTLLIDQRSASFAASDRDLAEWARGRRIFVSSLITDMRTERAAVRAAIESFGAVPVMFEEELGASDVSAEEAYLSGVRSSEIYIGLFGPRYGVRMSDRYSATHAEFNEAERQGLRLCLFVAEANQVDMDGPQADLIAGLRNAYTTSSWSDPHDLARRVRRRLTDLASEAIAPWARVGRAVFRARELVDDGKSIAITADVISPAVHGELVQLRDRRSAVNFVSPTYAGSASVTSLTTRTTSGTHHEVTVTLSRQGRTGFHMAMSVNGVPANEVARRAVSDGVFGTSEIGESNRRMTPPIDPFSDIRGMEMDDSVLRPVARLLFSERLITDGIAQRIDSFMLGPAHGGARHLRVTWTPPNQYSGEPDPAPISLEGTVTGL